MPQKRETGAPNLMVRVSQAGLAPGLAGLAFVLGIGLPWPAPAAEPGAPLFDPIASVMQSPRCLNCHTSADRPTQADVRRVHQFNVRRGADGLGAPAMRCAACHTTRNDDRTGVPGAPHWQLPPRSMGWQTLTEAELCRTILDPAKNGRRSPADLFRHLTTDPLALWAWEPGKGRSRPPLTVDETRAALSAWIAAGTPCPDEKAAQP